MAESELGRTGRHCSTTGPETGSWPERTPCGTAHSSASRPLHRSMWSRMGAVTWLAPNSLCADCLPYAYHHAFRARISVPQAGLPYQLDPVTLDTLGESTLGGQLAASTLGAHYRVTTERQADGSTARRFVGFSVDASFGGATATFYEFDEQGRKIHQTRHPLEVRGAALELQALRCPCMTGPTAQCPGSKRHRAVRACDAAGSIITRTVTLPARFPFR